MLQQLLKGSVPLTVTGLAMLVVLAGTVVGLIVDPRIVTGAPVWLKPAKFAASIAIYTLTLAWIFSLLPEWRRMRRAVGWITAATLALEIVIIVLQAYRGTMSHFNVGSVLDGALFTIMGLAIVVQTSSIIALAVVLWRHRLADGALGWALRLGVTMTIVGASTGALMTQPTAAQLEAARAGERMTIAGAHTVGGPDGGPGLPGTGWSTEHGDLRVPHFVGLHALQLLPIIALALRARRVPDRTRVRLTIVAAGSYAGLFAILLAQALRGQSVFAPDGITLMLTASWVVVTVAAAAFAVFRPQATVRPAAVV